MQVFIGLGSNLDDPQTQILTAIEDIKNLEDTRLLHQSSLYHSPPMGPQDQPDYVNAVVEVDTALPPHVLLDNLQQLEQKHAPSGPADAGPDGEDPGRTRRGAH